MTAQTKCEKCGAWVEAFSVAKHICKPSDDLVYRLRKRAEIRRQIPGRKSVENGEPDRIADLLDEAAKKIELLDRDYRFMKDLAIGEEARAKELEKDLKYFTDPCNPACKPSICDCYQARFAINNRKVREA